MLWRGAARRGRGRAGRVVVGEEDEKRTTGTHRFSASSYSYSWPSSASRMNLFDTLEKETRASASNSSGSWGKEERRVGRGDGGSILEGRSKR